MLGPDPFSLSGRVALVTGGAGHVGSAIAEGLAARGANVCIIDNALSSSLDAARERLWVTPGRGMIWAFKVNLAWKNAISEVMVITEDITHRLDILVNCAALLDAPGLDVPFAEQTVEAWDRSFAVNLRAPFLLAQACAPLLAASGHGSIVNIASIYGMVGPDLSLYDGTGMGCGAAYAASKAGLLGLTRYLAAVLAPSVRVNAISPGGIARGQDAGFVERYCRKVPLGRMGTEADIVGAAVYLASDASGYVTGQNIVIDGGGMARW